MVANPGPAHVTSPVAPVTQQLPKWVTLVRAPNPGPMTLDGTNTWVLRAGAGSAGAVVIDPGPDDEAHLRAVAELGPVAGILVTHGHFDHTDGVERLRALTGAPLLPPTSTRVAGLTITALATPGHTADSVCYLVHPDEDATEQVVFTGDTILGRGTTVVAWPDGDLGDYLASLELLTAYRRLPALPGHGPALADCGAAAAFYLAHRRARLEQVRAAVAAGATTPSEVVDRIYTDVDPSLRAAAEWSVQAQLAYLNREPSDHSQSLDQP
jgi:glyoxylase-like metal-dependent hydrolase (beta-lactamase superfamily II)